MTQDKEMTILLIEDDPGHARLIEKNLTRNHVAHRLIQRTNGQDALNYLRGEGSEGASGEVLVLLDLNLPGLDGYQVLREIKGDPATRAVPVVILTTTEDRREVQRCYELGCSLFVTKPVNYEDFLDTLRRLSELLAILKLPNLSP
jgi:CheY-like chemotaxis protein